MRLYKIITILTLILCSGQSVMSQQSKDKEYLYVDSTLLNQEEADTTKKVEAPPEDMGYEADDNYVEKKDPSFVDTALVKNEINLSYDSLLAIKSKKQYRYASSMDSLLKALQQEELKQQHSSERQTTSWLEKVLSSDVTKVTFWAIAVFFVLFIISKLFITKGFFQRNTTKAKITVEQEAENEPWDPNNFERKAAEAAVNKNFRLATRYLYLQSLHLLSDAGIVTLTADKTNAQYLYELAGKPYAEKFASLTLNYEYIWYGEFAIDETTFEKLNQQFKSFNIELKKS